MTCVVKQKIYTRIKVRIRPLHYYIWVKENSECYYDPKRSLSSCNQDEDGKIKRKISTNMIILSVLKNNTEQ
jgi:hypothetical protein